MFVVLANVGSHTTSQQNVEKITAGATSMDDEANPIEYCFFEDGQLHVSHLITYRVKKEVSKADEKKEFKKAFLRAIDRSGSSARLNLLR